MNSETEFIATRFRVEGRTVVSHVLDLVIVKVLHVKSESILCSAAVDYPKLHLGDGLKSKMEV